MNYCKHKISSVIFERCRETIFDWVKWSQSGFQRNRSASENLWILRNLFEKAREYDCVYYIISIDYKAAFDGISRNAIYEILSSFLPLKLVHRVMQLYDGARLAISTPDPNKNNFFDHSMGIKQGCPASPSFFTAVLSFLTFSVSTVFKGISLGSLNLLSLEYADDQIYTTV